jgi:DNA-binding NarL/FixJ family response regulator
MLRVALLDDHPAVLAGLRRLIEPEPDMTVVATAREPSELHSLLDRVQPDVLVLDHDLSHADGLAHCLRVKRRAKPPAVVVYSAYAGPTLALAARVAGADALVDKAEPVRQLLNAIRRTGAGFRLLPGTPRDTYAAAIERVPDEDLPILAMLLDGATLSEIALALRSDPGEVAWRAQRIVGRLCPGLRHRPVEGADGAGQTAPPSRA